MQQAFFEKSLFVGHASRDLVAVLATNALAPFTAFNAGLEALTVLLHTERAFAITSTRQKLSVLRQRLAVLAVKSHS